MKCQIKSKYRGIWQTAQINLDGENFAFVITREEKSKIISFKGISECRILTIDQNQILQIQIQKRIYEIKSTPQKLNKVVDAYKLWHFFQNYKEVPQRKMQIPKIVNYKDKKGEILSKLNELRKQQNNIEQQLIESQKSIKIEENKVQSQAQIIQYENYYKIDDWKRDIQQGGLLFINEEKKSLQPKIIKYLISRFLSTGSFMGISFPVFAMKPQSNLQTYCRCLSLAPRLLTGIKNPLDRIKAFNATILSLSLRFLDIDKSYNPTLGQTFQSYIEGYQIVAEQISHHPPISAFLLNGQGFRLSGFLQAQASMGFNTARGRFYGDIIVQFEDGGKLIGRMPCGLLSGYLYGRYVFNPDGANYVFDPVNQLLCSYEVTNQDVMEGYIGRLKNNNWTQFCQLMNTGEDPDRRKSKYQTYEHIPQISCEKIYSRVRVKWPKEIIYDDEVYLDYENLDFLPPKLSKKIPKNLLLSDSRWRKDIILRSQQKMDESQEQKQKLQQEQRRIRKLRQKYKSNN